MATEIQIRGVPDEVKTRVKRRAVAEGVSMSDYLLRVIRDDLALPTRDEWLERLRLSAPAQLDMPAADTLRLVRGDEAR